mmetsp:Transcript_30169/g.82933  ORF Transcript_30169/g.82933 Transcript_30169/m.82933 type:complete len:329 (+) Transcript_30169:689-1675(+)
MCCALVVPSEYSNVIVSTSWPERTRNARTRQGPGSATSSPDALLLATVLELAADEALTVRHNMWEMDLALFRKELSRSMIGTRASRAGGLVDGREPLLTAFSKLSSSAGIACSADASSAVRAARRKGICSRRRRDKSSARSNCVRRLARWSPRSAARLAIAALICPSYVSARSCSSQTSYASPCATRTQSITQLGTPRPTASASACSSKRDKGERQISVACWCNSSSALRLRRNARLRAGKLKESAMARRASRTSISSHSGLVAQRLPSSVFMSEIHPGGSLIRPRIRASSWHSTTSSTVIAEPSHNSARSSLAKSAAAVTSVRRTTS